MLAGSRSLVRSVLSLAGISLAALPVACGAPPDGSERVGEAESAVSCSSGCAAPAPAPFAAYHLPAAVRCTLVAGADPLGLKQQSAVLRSGAAYEGSDATILEARRELAALGTDGLSLTWETALIRPAAVKTSSLLAVDVTQRASSEVLPTITRYADVSGVSAGYFSCTLPGVTQPLDLAVYAPTTDLEGGPTGCSSCSPDI